MAGGTQGWNRPGAGAKGRGGGGGPRVWRGAAAGVVVAAIGCALTWYALYGVRAGDGEAERRGAGDAPGKAQEAARRPPRPGDAAGGASAKKRLAVPKPSGEYIEKRDEVAAPQPLEELQAAMTNTPPTRKVAFRNGAEQLIALATPSEPGGRVPPLPQITDEGVARELKEAMGHVIQAEEGDTEAVLEKKLVVAGAKEQFRELRDRDGYTFTEYLNALRDQANLDADFLAEAHRMSEEIYHDAAVSDEDYVKYRDQINEKLRERGLPEIE